MNENRNVMTDAVEEIDLLGIFLLLRQKLKYIILFAVLGGALAGCYSKFFITPTYTATAKIYMVSASRDSVVNLSDLQLGSNLASDYKELILSRPMLESVVQNLNLSVSPSALRTSVSIVNTSSSRILSIRATSPNPQLSANIANEFAHQAVNWLPEVMETNAPNIAEEAVPPTSKSAPNNTKNAMIGAIVFAVVYFAFSVIRYLLDDTIKSEDDMQNYLGISMLASIPDRKDFINTEKKKKSRRKSSRSSRNASK